MMFKKTLDSYNWNYEFIGEGLKWNGFKDKIYGYYNKLQQLHDNKIVVLSDARDVYCLREPDFFIEKIKDIVEDKIIVSCEMFLHLWTFKMLIFI